MIIDNTSIAGYISFRHAIKDPSDIRAPDGLPLPITVSNHATPILPDVEVPDDIPMWYLGSVAEGGLKSTFIEVIAPFYSGAPNTMIWYLSCPGSPTQYEIAPADPETPGDPVPEPAVWFRLRQHVLDAALAKLYILYNIDSGDLDAYEQLHDAFIDEIALVGPDNTKVKQYWNSWFVANRDLPLKDCYVYAIDVASGEVGMWPVWRSFYERDGF